MNKGRQFVVFTVVAALAAASPAPTHASSCGRCVESRGNATGQCWMCLVETAFAGLGGW